MTAGPEEACSIPHVQRWDHGTRHRQTVCAEARKSPSRWGERSFGKPPPDAQAALPEAHEWLISPATVEEVPLAGTH